VAGLLVVAADHLVELFSPSRPLVGGRRPT